MGIERKDLAKLIEFAKKRCSELPLKMGIESWRGRATLSGRMLRCSELPLKMGIERILQGQVSLWVCTRVAVSCP